MIQVIKHCIEDFENSLGLDPLSARKIPKNYSNLTGHIYSHKNKRLVSFESKLERDFYILLEFNKDVAKYQEQPYTINSSKGKFKQYTPDVEITYSDKNRKKWICEVKYKDEIKRKIKEYKEKFKEAISFAKSNNSIFKIITDDDIYSEYFENARFLLPYKDIECAEDDLVELISTMEHLQIATPEQILSHCSNNLIEQAKLIPALWHLVARGSIDVDLNKPLTMESSLTW
ncbi:MAG: heteromeric transposase endonuclease subunit TnsA [Rickettsiales bacterium]|nr:heteromeric transposase endonuclease subunit TnsA [Rickettsiales bacterium]